MSAPYWPACRGGAGPRNPAHSGARSRARLPSWAQSSPRSCSASRLLFCVATTCSEPRPWKPVGRGEGGRSRREEERGGSHTPPSLPAQSSSECCRRRRCPCCCSRCHNCCPPERPPGPAAPVAIPGYSFLSPAFYAHCHYHHRYYPKRRKITDQPKRTTYTFPNCSSVSQEERG